MLIPDVSPVDLLGLREESPEKEGKAMASGKDGMELGDDEQQPPDFSMAAGEFLEVYAGQVSREGGDGSVGGGAAW